MGCICSLQSRFSPLPGLPSVALYILTGTDTMPNVTVPDHIDLIAPPPSSSYPARSLSLSSTPPGRSRRSAVAWASLRRSSPRSPSVCSPTIPRTLAQPCRSLSLVGSHDRLVRDADLSHDRRGLDLIAVI